MASPDTANVTTGPGTLYYAPLGTTEPTTDPITGLTVWPAGWVPVGYTAEGNSFSSSLSVDKIEVAELLDAVRHVTTSRDTKVAFSMAEMTLAHLKLLLNGGTTTTDDAVITDAATTNADATLTSASAGFTTAVDQGKPISGAGIDPGTTVLSVTNATTIEMSSPATATAAGVSVTIAGRWGSYFEPPEVGQEVRVMLAWLAEDLLERVVYRKVLQTGNSEIARRKGADYAKMAAEFSLEQPGGGLKPMKHWFASSRVAA